MIPEAEIEHRMLLLAPTLRDAEVSSRILQDARVGIAPFADMSELLSELKSGAGGIIITDHPAHSVTISSICAWRWSDSPIGRKSRSSVLRALTRSPSGCIFCGHCPERSCSNVLSRPAPF